MPTLASLVLRLYIINMYFISNHLGFPVRWAKYAIESLTANSLGLILICVLALGLVSNAHVDSLANSPLVWLSGVARRLTPDFNVLHPYVVHHPFLALVESEVGNGVC